MGTTIRNIDLEIGKDLIETKQRLYDLNIALNQRDDFIIWLIEVKLEDEFYLNELWDEFDKYEKHK